MKKVYLFLIIPVLSLCLFGCENKELKEKYDHGVKLIENKEWERATTIFKDLGDYKDSKDNKIGKDSISFPVVAPNKNCNSFAWSDKPFTVDTNDDSLVSLLNDSDTLSSEFM